MTIKLIDFEQQILKSLVKRKGLIFGLVLSTAVVIFIGRQTVWKPQAQANYQTARVVRGTIVSTVSASGQIVSTNRMAVTTQASGQVKEVLVREGDSVASGQPLIELILDPAGQQKSTQAWSTYLQAKTMLSSAEAAAYSSQAMMYSKWKTYTDLATNSTYQNPDGSPNTGNRVLPQFTIAQDDWLAAEANFKNQQAIIGQNRTAVASAWTAYQLVAPVVGAPISGKITDITMVPGMVLSNSSTSTITTTQIADIVANTLPVAIVNLAEVDVGHVKTGQKITLTADAFPGKSFAGTLIGVNRTGVVSSGVTNYPTTIQLDSPNDELLPNMSVSASIIIATKQDVLLVPPAAIQTQNDRATVKVLIRGKIQSLPVETGLTNDTQTEIVSGLTAGETVIVGISNPSRGQTTSPFSTFRFGGFGGAGIRPGGAGGTR